MLISMENGIVKWFSNKEGVGFISQEEGDDVFVRRNVIQGKGPKILSRGDIVEFEMENNQNDSKASKVVKL